MNAPVFKVFLPCMLFLGGYASVFSSFPVFAEPSSEKPPSEKPLPSNHPPVAAPKANTLPANHPPVANPNAEPSSAEAIAAAMRIRQLESRGSSLAMPEVSEQLPSTTIRVVAMLPTKAPLESSEVQLGIMKPDGTRSTEIGRTNTEGKATFENLLGGTRASYRVRVPYKGATYLSVPFRLDQPHGMQVEVSILETTEDPKSLLQVRGTTSFEFRENRLHVVQQSQLMNMGQETFVFPKEGMQITLPEGFKAFQSERVMSDQKIIANEQGFLMYGSLPPGQIALMWGFDLPLESGNSEIELPWPFRTYMYRVISESAPGFEMDVKGFGQTSYHDQGESPVWIAQSQWRPSDTQPQSLKIQLRGIPGPGPWRWIALIGSILVLGFGCALALRKRSPSQVNNQAFKEKQSALLQEAQLLEAQAQKGEIGPQYKAERLQQITDELALLIQNDQKS